MGQGFGLGVLGADGAGGGGGLSGGSLGGGGGLNGGGGRRVVLHIVVKAHHFAGGRVDLVVVFLVVGGVELHIVDEAAVIPVQLRLDEGHVGLGKARVGQGLGLGVLGSDGGLGGGGGALGQGHALGLDDHAGKRVHLALISAVAGGEGHQIVFHAVPAGQFGAQEGHRFGGEPRPGEGGGAGGLVADVGQLARIGAGGEEGDGQGGKSRDDQFFHQGILLPVLF